MCCTLCVHAFTCVCIYFAFKRVATDLEKPGILGEFSEPRKLMEFSGCSVQPQGKIVTNKVILVGSNICIKLLGKQDHYDLGVLTLPSKYQVK